MGSAGDRLTADFIARRPEGLARVYEYYASDLVSVARHVLGNRGAAEDCVHDALLRIWRTPGSYHPERGALRSFLIACVRNQAMTMLRGSTRRTDRERANYQLESTAQPPTELQIGDHVEVARLRAAMERLPSDQRVALEHAYFKNKTQRQIADDLGVPLGTIKSRISHAMRTLADELREPEVSRS
ncbi:MAG TPA: sigma-70 family RNA polymerase sigma factor [Candidatus Acidoferrales bacterium]|nr:sigma-70 family RNA polymerase sigma factor [Candidatus Acidoferrales bacterium]